MVEQGGSCRAPARIPLFGVLLPHQSRATSTAWIQPFDRIERKHLVAARKSWKRRVPGSIAGNEKLRVQAFTSFENFHYFLTELELVVASGSIVWSVASVTAAQRRLVKLLADLGQVEDQSENGSQT